MGFLSERDSKRIADAVAAAEEKSGGEITTAVIAESDDYGFQELIVAVAAGAVAFFALAASTDTLTALLERWFWSFDGRFLPMLSGLAALVVGAVVYFLVQIPALDRLIISRGRMAEAVRRRAIRHFVESGTYDTVDNTGILIFVSLLERRVELVADRGINAKVDSSVWSDVVNELVAGIGAGKTVDAMVDAVERCGELLSGNVARRHDDTNELDDRPTELGRGT